MPIVNRLPSALRAAGGTVAWVVPGGPGPDGPRVATGTVTGVCVEGTVRDASTLGYRAIRVGGRLLGRAGRQPHRDPPHRHRNFGDVRPTDEVFDLIQVGRA